MPYDRPTLTKLAEADVQDCASHRLDFSPDNAGMTRAFHVQWAEKYDAALSFVGASRIKRGSLDSPGAPVALERLTPLRHPDLGLCYARRVSITKGVGLEPAQTDPEHAGGGKSQPYRWGRAEVDYAPFPYPILPDGEVASDQEYMRYFRLRDFEASSEYVTLPSGSMRYAVKPEAGSSGSGGSESPEPAHPDNVPIPFAGGVVIPTINFKAVWYSLPADILNFGDPFMKRITGHRRPADPAAGTLERDERSYIGCVNRLPFPGPSGFPAGSLLCTNIRPMEKTSALGSVEYDIEVSLSFKPNPGGWNALLYHGTGANAARSGWYYVSRSSPATYHAPGTVPDDKSLYAERDFHLIFSVT